MNKLWSVLLVFAMALGTQDVWAKRMGGGMSFGKQSGNVTQRNSAPPSQQAAPQQAPAQNAAARPATTNPAGAAAAAPKRPWGAMLGGLAAGLGLAWLASSLGLGEAFGQVLLFALLAMVVMAVIGMVMRRRAPAAQASGMAYQGAGQTGHSQYEPVTPRSYSPQNVGNDASARPWERSGPAALDHAHRPSGGSMIGSALGGSQSWGVPAGFDAEGFLKASKANFVSLQDAWDRSDIPALRAMMTDGMLEEIRSQLAEREQARGGVNKTEVVMLDAQLLGIEELQGEYMASVEFSGLIREDASAGPNPFREVWNITRPKNGPGGWLVAGVQALQ